MSTQLHSEDEGSQKQPAKLRGRSGSQGKSFSRRAVLRCASKISKMDIPAPVHGDEV